MYVLICQSFHKVAVNKLIGSNPGYVGMKRVAIELKQLRIRNIVYFFLDEIEKADPEIYNVFYRYLMKVSYDNSGTES